MKVFELSKELGVTNKEVIDFFKENGYKVSSHVQVLSDEMIEKAKKGVKPKTEEESPEEGKAPEKATPRAKKPLPQRNAKVFSQDEQIPCRSAVPWYLEMTGLDRNVTYKWMSFGDVEYVPYRDLQSWRRKPIVKDVMILIEDPDLCEQWKHDLGNLYQKYLGIDYPEEFFDKSDDEFERLLKDASSVLREVIKYTAMDMIRNENYPSVKKLTIIDKILDTGIKDFL